MAVFGTVDAVAFSNAVAVTQNDETNMVICQVAYSIFKIEKNMLEILFKKNGVLSIEMQRC